MSSTLFMDERTEERTMEQTQEQTLGLQALMPYDYGMDKGHADDVRAKLVAFLERKERGAQKRICEISGVDRGTLWRFKRGEDIEEASVDAIADALERWDVVSLQPAAPVRHDPWRVLASEFRLWAEFISDPGATTEAKRAFLRAKLGYASEIVDILMPPEKRKD